MRAEAAFLQGRFVDAQIELERAYAQISGNGQENMALCCDFLAWRLSLCTGDAPRCTMARRRQELLRQHNVSWLNILDATAAYYGALTGGTEEIPPVFREHRLSSLSLLAPGRPHAGDDRKSGLAGAGGLREGHWPQRRAAGDMRRPALCAGGAARPHPDGGGLRPAGQGPGGPGAAGAGVGRWRDRRLRGALCGELPLLAGAAGGGRLGHGPAGGAAGRGLPRSAALPCGSRARSRRPLPC